MVNRPLVRLAGFAVALGVVFGAAYGIGAATSPNGPAPAPPAPTHETGPTHTGETHE